MYIVGYVIAKNKRDCDNKDNDFYNKFGFFTANLSRGGLHVSGDPVLPVGHLQPEVVSNEVVLLK